MALSESFTTIFDKAESKGNAHQYENKWVVEEHDKSAAMTRLEVNSNGTFLGFDHDLVKGVKDTTTLMSSHLEDKDCDGIAFLIDKEKREHLVFVELKSNFDIQKIQKAFHQIAMSFLKMHSWLSLCRYYNLKNLKVHFVTACKCYKEQDQEANVMLRISQAQQLGEDSFETKFLKPLLTKRYIKIKLSSLGILKIFHSMIAFTKRK